MIIGQLIDAASCGVQRQKYTPNEFVAGDGVCVRCRETVQVHVQPLKWRVGLPHRIPHVGLILMARHGAFLKQQSVEDNNQLLLTEKQSCALVAQHRTMCAGFCRLRTGFSSGAVRGRLQPPDECRKYTLAESHARSARVHAAANCRRGRGGDHQISHASHSITHQSAAR